MVGNIKAVYVISVAAELAGCHPQTLRIYERKGLLSPARTGGGSRRYSDADLSRFQHIQDLTDQGINLSGVKKILELEAELGRLRAQMTELTNQSAQEVAETHRQYRRDLVPVPREITVYRRGRRK